MVLPIFDSPHQPVEDELYVGIFFSDSLNFTIECVKKASLNPEMMPRAQCDHCFQWVTVQLLPLHWRKKNKNCPHHFIH